jgi:hypothetical protein
MSILSNLFSRKKSNLGAMLIAGWTVLEVVLVVVVVVVAVVVVVVVVEVVVVVDGSVVA